MNRYSEYKDSGIEWIGEIPRDWEVKKLKCFSDISLGKMLTPRDKGGMLLKPYLRSRNVQDGFADLSDVKEMWFSEQEMIFLELKRDDLLVNEGGQVGRCCLWDQSIQECFFQNSLNRIRVFEGSSKYLFYLLQTYFHKGYFDSIVDRVSIPHLTKEKLAEVKAVLPPLPEQTRIAQYLDRKTSRIDSLIEKAKRKIELLKEQRTALISQCVTKGLDPNVEMKDSGIAWIGEIPRDWEVKKLKCFSDISLGKMLTPRDKGGMLLKPYLRSRNVQDGFADLSDVKEMWFSEQEMIFLELKRGDLLVNEGGQVGRSCLWDQSIQECFFQNSLNRIRLFEGSSKYLFYLLQTYFHKGYFDSIVDRVSIPHLTKEKLAEVKAVLPPLPEQIQIAQYLDKETSRIDSLIEKEKERIALLKEYRQSLISSVVTGKVRVTEDAA